MSSIFDGYAFIPFDFIFLVLPISIFIYYRNTANVSYVLPTNTWISLISLGFYSTLNSIYFPLFLGSFIFNIWLGLNIYRTRERSFAEQQSRKFKIFLTIGVTVNILLFIYLKYMDFFVADTNLPNGPHRSMIYATLFLGIGLFTFAQIVHLLAMSAEEYSSSDPDGKETKYNIFF
jgi:hypothetical protein